MLFNLFPSTAAVVLSTAFEFVTFVCPMWFKLDAIFKYSFWGVFVAGELLVSDFLTPIIQTTVIAKICISIML